jgi:hypothetical protein
MKHPSPFTKSSTLSSVLGAPGLTEQQERDQLRETTDLITAWADLIYYDPSTLPEKYRLYYEAQDAYNRSFYDNPDGRATLDLRQLMDSRANEINAIVKKYREREEGIDYFTANLDQLKAKLATIKRLYIPDGPNGTVATIDKYLGLLNDWKQKFPVPLFDSGGNLMLANELENQWKLGLTRFAYEIDAQIKNAAPRDPEALAALAAAEALAKKAADDIAAAKAAALQDARMNWQANSEIKPLFGEGGLLEKNMMLDFERKSSTVLALTTAETAKREAARVAAENDLKKRLADEAKKKAADLAKTGGGKTGQQYQDPMIGPLGPPKTDDSAMTTAMIVGGVMGALVGAGVGYGVSKDKSQYPVRIGAGSAGGLLLGVLVAHLSQKKPTP